MVKKLLILVSVALISISCSKQNPASPNVWEAGALNTAAPSTVTKLVFIHHSVGGYLMATGNGNMGAGLNTNNYYVSETNYGWSAPLDTGCTGLAPIGSNTNTGDWLCWFNDTTMPTVYANTSHSDYPSNTMSDPGGSNAVIMFKSCYPNSEVDTSIDDEKAIYNSMLTYFAAHQDKMFVLLIPPPEIIISSAALTRELSNWLANRETGWLSAYGHNNVYTFDLYNVLTHPDNHHWVKNGKEEHIVANSQNTLYYYSGSDDHPTSAGTQKATAEFLPLLNGWYNKWKGI